VTTVYSESKPGLLFQHYLRREIYKCDNDFLKVCEND
jgi:hypothetical protein